MVQIYIFFQRSKGEMPFLRVSVRALISGHTRQLTLKDRWFFYGEKRGLSFRREMLTR